MLQAPFEFQGITGSQDRQAHAPRAACSSAGATDTRQKPGSCLESDLDQGRRPEEVRQGWGVVLVKAQPESNPGTEENKSGSRNRKRSREAASDEGRAWNGGGPSRPHPRLP